MQIISDFHDYYDIGMQNGIDPQLPYRRFRREESVGYLGFRDRKFRYYYTIDNYLDDLKIIFFGFAGKIYPGFSTCGDSNEISYKFDINNTCPNCFDAIIDYLMRCGRSLNREKERQTLVKRLQQELVETFELKDKAVLLNLFEKYQTAIFVYQFGSGKIVIDERLNQYHFQKVLPPMEAFQELTMYVGARLTKPVIEEPPI